MEKTDYLDHITEAYYGLMGEGLQKSAIKRIDWICGQTEGKRALDVGCSQGICELLLARSGFEVVGIDIAETSISYAKDLLTKEPQEVQERVQFMCADFLSDTFNIGTFDTLIMSELLEHLYEPEKMLVQGLKYLHEGSRIIITIPFGINDFPDHKHTFYLSEIYEMLQNRAIIEKIEFFGAWIGFSAVVSNEIKDSNTVNLDLIKQMEKAFFQIERPLRDQQKNGKELIQQYQEKTQRAVENYEKVKQWLSTESEARAKAEMKYLQLQFLMQQRELESYDLQRSLTQRIVITEEELKKAEEELKKSEGKLKKAEEELKDKTLPSIWYTMAGSRVGRTLCRFFRWYHESKRLFHK